MQILDTLAREFKPHIWMNMHSGMEALFMPYDHVASLPDDPAGLVSFHLLQQLNAIKCRGKCAVGSGGKSVGQYPHPSPRLTLDLQFSSLRRYQGTEGRKRV